MNSINCRGRLVSLNTPRIMGILNLTPDSFYKNSRTNQLQVLHNAEKMLEQGADFLDLGGYSSRPGADFVSQEEELKRIIPAVETLIKHFPESLISVDTFRSEVARQSIEAGACIINDISAGELDSQMWEIIARYQVPYVAMHMRGTPQTMQNLTHYEHIINEIIFYFSQKKRKAQEMGINDLILDPGFGFAKTMEQNYEVFSHLEDFKILNLPLLVGISRKSMLYKFLNISPEEALNATTTLHTIALIKGAKILRLHDVKPAVECLQLIRKLNLLPNEN